MSSLTDLRNIKEVVESVMESDLVKKSRTRNTINAIKIYCFVARKITKQPYAVIGHIINKSHATILHHVKDFETLIKYDLDLNDATKFCMRLCRDMLGQKNVNYRDTIELYWRNLTLDQQKKLSSLVTKYYITNTKINEY